MGIIECGLLEGGWHVQLRAQAWKGECRTMTAQSVHILKLPKNK